MFRSVLCFSSCKQASRVFHVQHPGIPILARCFSVGNAGRSERDFQVDVIHLKENGDFEKVTKAMSDLVQLKNETNLPIRDMRMFFSDRHQGNLPPMILSRPSSQCYLLNLDHIKLLCQKHRCLIMHPEENSVKTFVAELRNQISSKADGRTQRNLRESNMHLFLNSLTDRSGQKFELLVLETTLATVTNKFKRHLNLLKPVLDLLLTETASNPSAAMLRRMLAFRKSLNAFDMNVKNVRSAVAEILKVGHDMDGMCLTKMATGHDVSDQDREEIELLLEAYNADLKEIEVELLSIKEQIEDTNDFINIHLNSIRNRIIKMSLFMEMGTMALGSGALCAGIFGMNLTHGFEEHQTAFYITCGGITVMVGSMFGLFVNRYNLLSRDVSSARSYQALKHFFNYVENIENAIHSTSGKTIDKREFRKLLEPVIGTQMTEKEVDMIFKILDENLDGIIDIDELTDHTTYAKTTMK